MQNGGDVLAAESLAGARLTEAFASRCPGEDRHADGRRRANADRKVLVGKVNGESRIDVTLEYLRRPIGLEVVVARVPVRDHIEHDLRGKPQLAAKRQCLGCELTC